MNGPQPDPERLAEALQRASFVAEHVPARSNQDASRILAFDVLAEFVDEIYEGEREQVAWALLHADKIRDLAPHEERLIEDTWQKINEDAERSEWERLGFRLRR